MKWNANKSIGTSQSGFSLIELGVALVALGIIAASLLAYFRFAGQEQVLAEQRDLLHDAESALIGFAYHQHRLPCPDSSGDGIEDCTADAQVGQLPWRTIGLPNATAGEFKYGVYRQADTAATQDRDLTRARDRLPPLVPQGRPPLVQRDGVLLGNNNLLDFCYALNLAGVTTTGAVEADRLGIVDHESGVRRNVAFALAAPGMLDADLSGSRFDGHQATASNASPTFDSPMRPRHHDYDDRVRAVAFEGMFSQLQCGQALATIGHSHFNAAIAAAVMHQGIVDYEEQLKIKAMLASAGVASATAGVMSATGGLANGVANVANATAAAILSYGTASALLAPAIASVVTNTAAVVTSVGTLAAAIAAKIEADRRVTDVAPLVTRSESQADTIEANARAGDASGF